MRVCLSAIFAVALSSCALYFPGDDDPDPCDDFGGNFEQDPAVPAVGQRNPQSGVCEFFGGGGPFPCDPQCGPCPAGEDEAGLEAQPSWGLCESECSFLDETQCQETTGCRAIYLDSASAPVFSECWAVDMTGPIQGGGCSGLDAWECSRHDDCSATHTDTCGGTGNDLEQPGCAPGEFLSCNDEEPSRPGGNCYEEVVCADAPPDCPTDTLPGVRDGCYTGFCVPLSQCEAQPACGGLDENTCIGRADCSPSFRGSDCSCDATGCTCATLDYMGCDELAAP